MPPILVGNDGSNLGGSSPIGTSSPNSGSTANTNSSYGPGAFTTGGNAQAGVAYTVQNTDYQGIVFFSTASPVTVSLNSAVQKNFTCTIFNTSTGVIKLQPPVGTTVNGAASLTLPSGAGCQVLFINGVWIAYVGATFIPVVPTTHSSPAHQWMNGYNATTGAWADAQPAFTDLSGTATAAQLPTPTTSAIGGVKAVSAVTHEWVDSIDGTGAPHLSQPAFADVSGNLDVSQLPSAGWSGTVTLAKLTTLGANGSLTVQNGIITAVTQPT